MKYPLTLFVISLCFSASCIAQGTSCSNAISISLNANVNSYSTSSTNDVNAVCADNGSGPVTWFQFTTNGSGQCPLLSITAADNQPCEVALYTSCSGNMTNNLEAGSSMCFQDGQGLWAPAESYIVAPNTTYYLRVKTSTATTISISGQNHLPSNDDCAGALPINNSPRTDNNSCHHGGPSVTPAQLCAFTLENTAFYEYYIASPGSSIITISSISCDNGNGNNSSGFQIGFFTGTCNSLTPLTCSSGSGIFVDATTPVLAADTKVYVAVDGVSGSNCKYTIQASNAYILAEGLKNFSGWKQSNSNILKWTGLYANVKYYEIQRADNGKDFRTIATSYKSSDANEIDYNFEDRDPLQNSFYRLKQIDINGREALSKIVHINRGNQPLAKMKITNPVKNSLILTLETNFSEKTEYAIVNDYGQILFKGIFICSTGKNMFYKEISNLPKGKYHFVVATKDEKFSETFIKL